MAARFHVDEVDDDQAGHVAQAKLAGDLVRRLQVRGVGGLLDIMLARRPAGVDVDRHQGFGGIDDQIAAGFELDERLRSEEHTSELQTLMRISYAVFCLKKQKTTNINT